jgi:chromosome segregation ATPase
LTSDELRAIRDYIEERIREEHAEISFRLYALQNDFDVTVRKSSDTITDLYQELNEKKDLIEHYKNSDETITKVHKQKEQRWEKKQELLVSEIEKLGDETARTKTRLNNAEKELEEKSNQIETLEENLIEANKVVATVDEAKQVLSEYEENKKDILKLKMEIDKRDRLVQTHERTINALKNEVEELKREKKINDLKVTSVQDELRKQMKEVGEKCNQLSETQFKLQVERRHTEKIQIQLRQATEDVQNYKRMIESAR